MALQMSFKLDADRTYPEAYIRIAIARSLPTASYIHLYYYENVAAREANAPRVFEREYVATEEELALLGGPYTSMYTFLKSLPEFAGAVDV